MSDKARAIIGSVIFFILVPVVVAWAIPWYLIIGGWISPPILGLTFIPWIGWVLIALGVAVLIDCFTRFAIKGLGTPAPIAPTQRLVVDGAYRYVRNPMCVAVVTIIFGQALVYGCHWVLLYTAGVWLATHLFVLYYEEPTLKRQFPDDYADYFANVPRWIPRTSPWRPAVPTPA